MSTPLRVAFLSSDPGSASARVRIVAHLPGLRDEGIEADLIELPRSLLARPRVLAGLTPYDLVVLHRRLLDPLSLTLLRRAARRLVWDVDDAVWERPSHARWPRGRRRLARLLPRLDGVVAGSAYLRDQLASRHAQVRLLRPAPPPATLPHEPDSSCVRLVWTGSRATLPYLEWLGPVLKEVCSLRPQVILDVLADAPPALPGVRLEFHPWSLEREAQVLARGHVGLYPLPDDPWSRGKCAYKILLYMHLGLPSVGSPRGGGAELLGTGAGIVAADADGWREALLALIDDPEQRRALGQRALDLAQAEHSLAARTSELAGILRRSIESSNLGVARR